MENKNHLEFPNLDTNATKIFDELLEVNNWELVSPETKILHKTSTQPMYYDTFKETCEHYGQEGIRYTNNEGKEYTHSVQGWYFWDHRIIMDNLRDVPARNQRCILSASILEGKNEYIDYLLKDNYNVNIPDRDNRTPLFFAIETLNYDAFIKILENGGDIFHKDEFGQTVFNYASHGNVNAEITLKFIKHLLALGASVDSPDEEGDTALINAVRSNNVSLVKLLIESGANVNVKNNEHETPIHLAVSEGWTEIADLLVNAELTSTPSKS